MELLFWNYIVGFGILLVIVVIFGGLFLIDKFFDFFLFVYISGLFGVVFVVFLSWFVVRIGVV